MLSSFSCGGGGAMATPAENDLALIAKFEEVLESASSVQPRSPAARALSERLTALLLQRHVRTAPFESEAAMDRAFESAETALRWLLKALVGDDPAAPRPLPDAITKAREEIDKWKAEAGKLLKGKR
jgi:hypothetical protein